MKNFTLSDAIILAAKKFSGLTDKAGMPYIEHLLRVMLKMNTIEGKIAAVLHDIIEDTMMETSDLIKLGISPFIVGTIETVSRRQFESYDEFITRIIGTRNPLAVELKLNDIEDNANPSRLLYLEPEEASRLARKYADARKRLMYEVG